MSATITPEFEAEIRRMIDSTGVERTLRYQLKMTVQQLAGLDPEMAPQMQDVVDRLDASILIENLIPVYAEHYTQEMVTTVADWYSTDIGRAFIELQPDVMSALMPISQAWVMGAVQQIMMEVIGQSMVTDGVYD
jgi:uncharacterized protein